MTPKQHVWQRGRYAGFLLALLAPLVAVPHLALAAEEGARREGGSPARDEQRIDIESNVYRELAYSIHDHPSWWPRVLAKLMAGKPAVHTLEQSMLFRRDGKPTFLAVLWKPGDRESGYERRLELYQVNVISQGNVRLTLRREYRDRFLKMVEPTGRDTYRDGVANIFLDYGSSGSASLGYGLKVFRLERASVNVTPDNGFLPHAAEDLNGDGAAEIIAYDYRWGDLLRDACDCMPVVDVVFEWRDGAYIRSCRSFPSHYKREVESYRKAIAGHPRQGYSQFLKPRLGIVLNLLQSGRLAEARQQYEATVSEARGAVQKWPGSPTLKRDFVDKAMPAVERGFKALFDLASRTADQACPLTAVRKIPE